MIEEEVAGVKSCQWCIGCRSYVFSIPARRLAEPMTASRLLRREGRANGGDPVLPILMQNDFDFLFLLFDELAM